MTPDPQRSDDPDLELANIALGLSLSGGGFRASAFHLGVLKRLRELGLLSKVVSISTVSGGSIVGAALVCRNINRNVLDADEWNSFETDMIAFMRRGIRNQIFGWPLIICLIGLIPFLLSLLSSSLPGRVAWSILGAFVWMAICFSGFRIFGAYLLERQYNKHLFHGARLNDLENGQQEWKRSILINSTSLEYGEPLVFTTISGVKKGSLLPELEPGERRSNRVHYAAGSSKFASAVAASSAFPPVFGPVPVRPLLDELIEIATQSKDELEKDLYERARSRSILPVTRYGIDGGVYDNQGKNWRVMGMY